MEWSKIYGGSNFDAFLDVKETSDGGYITSGYTYSEDGEVTDTNNGGQDGLIVKFDDLGNVKWDKVYGGSENEKINSLIVTPNGDYILSGYSYSSESGDITGINQGEGDDLLMKIDDEGNISWSQLYGGSEFDSAEEIVQTTDGDLIVVGYSSSSESSDIIDVSNGERDGLIFKLSL